MENFRNHGSTTSAYNWNFTASTQHAAFTFFLFRLLLLAFVGSYYVILIEPDISKRDGILCLKEGCSVD